VRGRDRRPGGGGPWTSLPASATPQAHLPGFTSIPTLRELAALDGEWASPARARIAAIDRLARQAIDLAEMDWSFLYDRTRKLLSIGYMVAERRLDASHYDLLASEARFCTFVAIAQGHLPQESWFALGRLLTTAAGEPVLLSWDGSMFEYLMPLLVMPTYDDTLLDETCKAAVRRQIEYGRQRGVPWGISESGYSLLDGRLAYQYRAFGVPGLGLRRGLADDLVVAPYASALALMVAPEEACANLQRLASEGFEGELGFYEAIDYTPAHCRAVSRTPSFARTWRTTRDDLPVACAGPPRRPDADALRVRTGVPGDRSAAPGAGPARERVLLAGHSRVGGPHGADKCRNRRTVVRGPDTPAPEVQLLSNGRYHVMVTNAGGGYSRWKDLAVTRWREDATSDKWGTFCYLRDVATGAFWSTACQPTLEPADRFEAVFSEARAEFRSRKNQIESYTEIAVSPEDDVELRRLRLTNCDHAPRTIEVTSYAEVALATPPPRRCTRRSATCSSRPRSSQTSAPFSARGARVRVASRRPGCSI